MFSVIYGISLKFENKTKIPFLSLSGYFRLLLPQITCEAEEGKEINSASSDPREETKPSGLSSLLEQSAPGKDKLLSLLFSDKRILSCL